MAKARERVLAEVAVWLIERRREHPLRVAVDGRTACGKTTIADELAAAISRRGCRTIRTSIDGFHRPRAVRYARGRHSAEGYYFDARDCAAVRQLLLDPLGPGGDRCYRTASFDLERDEPLDQAPVTAEAESILIVDGTFLQRPELSGGWDVVIFIDVPAAVAAGRGVQRDAARLGGREAAKLLYRRRYGPAYAIYEESVRPRDRSHVIVENSDFEHPMMTIRGSGSV